MYTSAKQTNERTNEWSNRRTDGRAKRGKRKLRFSLSHTQACVASYLALNRGRDIYPTNASKHTRYGSTLRRRRFLQLLFFSLMLARIYTKAKGSYACVSVNAFHTAAFWFCYWIEISTVCLMDFNGNFLIHLIGKWQRPTTSRYDKAREN